MSLQQHIDELFGSAPSNDKGIHQEWLALLDQWEDEQKA